MKIDSFTVSVLENFASISPSIHIKEGNILETMQPVSKAVKATAVVQTIFPRTFSLFNLWKFISVLNMYKDPDVLFEEEEIVVYGAGGGRTTRLRYSEDELVAKVPDKKMKLPSVDVTTYLPSNVMKDLEKARRVLKTEEVHIVGQDGTVSIQIADSSNPLSDTHSISLGTTDKTFRAIFRADNLLLMPDDYDVAVCSKGIARFNSAHVEYFIAVEDDSEF